MLIQLPADLQGLKSATVRRWLKKVGESVAVGETIAHLAAADSQLEVQATCAGVLSAIRAQVGSEVSPGSALGVLEPANATAGLMPVLMPQAGNTMEEGTIVKWRVREGEAVKRGQTLCEIETDKATTEVEAADAGHLMKIVAAEGAVVPVKQPIAYMAGDNGAATLAAECTVAVVVKAQSGAATANAGRPGSEVLVKANSTTPPAQELERRRVRASPLARKIAAAKGIDLATMPNGSGPGRRILSTDLASLTGVPQGHGAKVTPSGERRRPMSKMRRAIARNLQTSKQTVPHFYVKLTIDADPLMAFYKTHKVSTGCTLNDVVLLAVGRVVGEIAAFRCRIEGDEIIESPVVNIGVAVSVSPPGEVLVVPVVMGVQSLTLGQLTTEARRVVAAARQGKLENVGKAVFTISNMGMLGVEEFSAIINPPESGILAISAVREAVMVKNGAMRPGRVMAMTLSVDHRVVDGAVAAQFMARLRELLESPQNLPV